MILTSRILIVTIFTLLGPLTAQSKDMDQLTPEPTGTEAMPDEQKEGEPKAEDSAPPESKEEKAATQDSSQADPRQNTPQWARDRLFFETSIGWSSVSASEGDDWNSLGMADVTIGYFVPLKLPMSSKLAAYFRFAPIYVTTRTDTVSFSGISESYGFGASWNLQIMPRFTAGAGAELALVQTNLKETNTQLGTEPPASSGANFGISGSANWWINQLFAIGPRLHLGFGTLQTMQFSIASSFHF